MVELSLVRDFVAIFGVIAGFSYYVLTVRNARKSQRLAEETRQLQFLNQIQSVIDLEANKWVAELLNMEWTDYEDFEKKYGSDNNLDNFAKRNMVWGQFETMGIALKRGLVDRDLLFELIHVSPLFVWVKFEDVIREIRRRYNQPLTMVHFEYLVDECREYMREKGVDTTIPDAFFRYVPDQ